MNLFILGAPDPEMRAIESVVLSTTDASIAYAQGRDGQRVHPGNAYEAVGFTPLLSKEIHQIICIECSVALCAMDFNGTVTHIDHHRPGDPGYGMPPELFWRGSSIGQVCELLGVRPNSELLLVAAADHCLAAAYRGQCPGVDPAQLMQWRVNSRAEYQQRKRGAEEILADIESARKILAENADPRGLADLRGHKSISD